MPCLLLGGRIAQQETVLLTLLLLRLVLFSTSQYFLNRNFRGIARAGLTF